MADKTIWICGGETGWAVRMDGRLLEAGLPIETAMRRAHKMADFVEEGDRSVELRVMQIDGSWRRLARRAPARPFAPRFLRPTFWNEGFRKAG